MDTDTLALLTAVCILASAMIGAFVSLRNGIKKNTDLTHQLSINVDGRLTQLLEITRMAARAEGVVEGEATKRITAAAEVQEVTAQKQLEAAEVQTAAAEVQAVAADKQTAAAEKRGAT